MKNQLEILAEMAVPEAQALGVVHTPREILRQTAYWKDSAKRVESRKVDLLKLIDSAQAVPGGKGRLILSGAGSSDFICRSAEYALRGKLGADVCVHPTTDLVTSVQGILVENVPYLMISVARSGDSPESVGAVEVVEKACSDVRHLAITCNPKGALAGLVASKQPRGEVVVLDEATNDQGLAMTASFTNLVVACQALSHLNDFDRYAGILDAMVREAEQILHREVAKLYTIANLQISRAVFLGDGALFGAARECALKVQELTDGTVMTLAETFLGLRHGPAAVIDDKTLLVYLVSSGKSARPYELDLVRQHKDAGFGRARLAVGYELSDGLSELVDEFVRLGGESGDVIPDELRPPVDVIVGQVLGLLKSLDLGLKPDEPSRSISRVVQGVVLHI